MRGGCSFLPVSPLSLPHLSSAKLAPKRRGSLAAHEPERGPGSEPHEAACFNCPNKSWLLLQPIQGGPLKSVF